MPHRVLHILSQRPSRTGSGVTLDSIVRCAAERGWDQRAIVGTPADEPLPSVGTLPGDRVHPLVFGTDAFPLGLPGMSDVMPYPSRRFSSLSPEEVERYLGAFTSHVRSVLAAARPDVIHSHHVWLLSSTLRDLAPDVPIVTHCHGTGLRQMELCPHLRERVASGCARNDAFCVLHEEHARRLTEVLGVTRDRIHVVGAGYREDIFHLSGAPEGGAQMTAPDAGRPKAGVPKPEATKAQTSGRALPRNDRPALVFAGKFSHAKGLPSLLDAVDLLAPDFPDLVLHVAGDGSGAEAEELRARMAGMAPRVEMHGMLDQPGLADLLRRSHVFVLPSMYEGLPLVLVEAAACGCDLVATALPGVVQDLAPALGEQLIMVPLPPMQSVDVPDAAALPQFATDLASALGHVLGRPDRGTHPDLARFRWSAVADRVERVWRSLL
ncbi:MAG: glycosyltransferase family 4 protein [Candidatus Eisenbacteria bacterium]